MPHSRPAQPAQTPREAVQTVLDDEVALRATQLAPMGRDVRLLVDAVAELLSGGKRLRAAFCYWGYRAAGGADSDGIVRVAAAMEMFQAAALIHDDVMDDSDTRRGRPAVHRRLATIHDEHRWQGPADRFGAAGAILAGNLCLTWTDTLFATSGLPRAELAAARPWFDEMRTQLMGGQFLDVLEATRGWDGMDTAQRVARARHVIRYKSAKYSVEQPLLIGAAAGGLGRRDLARLSGFGLAVGEAFQLRDDLLGVFGDPEQTGKPAGDDLREGKRTVLLAYTLDGAEPQDAQTVLAGLGRQDLSAAEVEQMRRIITTSDAVDRIEADIDALVEQAYEYLGACRHLNEHGTSALRGLVAQSTARSS